MRRASAAGAQTGRRGEAGEGSSSYQYGTSGQNLTRISHLTRESLRLRRGAAGLIIAVRFVPLTEYR